MFQGRGVGGGVGSKITADTCPAEGEFDRIAPADRHANHASRGSRLDPLANTLHLTLPWYPEPRLPPSWRTLRLTVTLFLRHLRHSSLRGASTTLHRARSPNSSCPSASRTPFFRARVASHRSSPRAPSPSLTLSLQLRCQTSSCHRPPPRPAPAVWHPRVSEHSPRRRRRS